MPPHLRNFEAGHVRVGSSKRLPHNPPPTLGEGRARARTAPRLAVAIAATIVVAAAIFMIWAVAMRHRPASAVPDIQLGRKDSPAESTADTRADGQTSAVAVGRAKTPTPSAVPPAYPGKVHGFIYPCSHGGAVRDVRISHDGRLAFSLGADGILWQFNAKDGSEISQVLPNGDETPRALAASPDGQRLLTAEGDGRLHLRDLQTGTAKILSGRPGAVGCLDISADGKRALSCGEDGLIRLWDLEKGAEVRHWPSPRKQPLSALRFSLGGWRAISSGPDRTVRAWDLVREVQTFQILGIYGPHGWERAPVAAALFPDGRSAAVGMTDGTIDLWDLETREVWKTCPAVGNPAAPVNAVAASPDGRLVAAASGAAGFFIWDLQNPAAYPCETPPVAAGCLAFADGRRVVAGCIDGTIHCWEVTGLKETGPATGAGSAAVVNKLAPPSDTQVAAGLEETRRQFPSDYTHLDDQEDYHDLAVKRLNQARGASDQPFQCYVLYLEARDLAALSDEPALGLRIAEEMGQAYDFDVRSAKVEVLHKAGASVRRPAAARAFLDAAMPLLKTAQADDAYASVAPLLPTVEQAGATAGDAVASALARKMTDLQKAFTDLQSPLKTLQTTPGDPDANQAVGEFYCLRKQEWDKGVRSLAVGREKGLAAAAAADVASPSAPERQAAVGDAWWDRAESFDGAALTPEYPEALRRRAYVWYNQALPRLRAKEAKRVADRLADLCQRYPDLPNAWEQWDVSKAAPVGDHFVRLKPGQAISTKEAVAGPVQITVVARGAQGDCFFQCRQGNEVLVVWETRTRESIVHVRRPIPLQRLAFTDDAGLFPPSNDAWNTFTCSITRDRMAPAVNGQPIVVKNHYKNEVSQARTFQLEPKGQQSLEVKTFTVKPLQP
jgi:WD domain, G-beta repeat